MLEVLMALGIVYLGIAILSVIIGAVIGGKLAYNLTKAKGK